MKSFLLFIPFFLFFKQNYAIDTIVKNNDTIKYQDFQIKLGTSFGYNYPYSVGFEMSLQFNEIIDLNFGIAKGIPGNKIGFGTRVYPVRKSFIAPYVGTYIYYAKGYEELKFEDGDDDAYYRISMNMALVGNAGLRIRYGRGHYMLLGCGYSKVLFEEEPWYIRGSSSEKLRNEADFYLIGNVSYNISLLFKLNRGSYRLDYNKPYYSEE